MEQLKKEKSSPVQTSAILLIFKDKTYSPPSVEASGVATATTTSLGLMSLSL
jgi:hypothetical protein